MADWGGYAPFLVDGRPLMSDGTLGEENMFAEPDWGGIDAPANNDWGGIDLPEAEPQSYDEEFLDRMQRAGRIQNPTSAEYAPTALSNVLRSRLGLPSEISPREQARQDEQLKYRLWNEGYRTSDIEEMSADEYQAKRREFETDPRERHVNDSVAALRKALTSDYLPPENKQDWPQEMFAGADNLGEPLNVTALKAQFKAANAPQEETKLEDLGKKPAQAVGETKQLRRLEELRSEAYQRAQRGKLMDPEFTPKLMEMEALKTELKAKYPDFADEPEFKAFDKETTKWLKRAANANAEQFQKDVDAKRKEYREGLGGDFSGSEAGSIVSGLVTGTRSLGAAAARGAGKAINSTGAPGINVIGDALGRISDRLQYGNEVIAAANKQAVAEQKYGDVRGFLGDQLPVASSSLFQAAALSPAGMGGMTLGFGATTANDAYYQAKQEGLSDEQAAKHALIQGGVEMAVMTLFNKLGKLIPGLEGKQGLFAPAAEKIARETVGRQVKKAATRLAGENLEEVITSALQQVDSIKTLPSLKDKDVWTTKGKENDWDGGFVSSPGVKSVGDAMWQAVKQTTLMMGIGEAGRVAIRTFAADPTRKNYYALPREIREQHHLRDKSTEWERAQLAEKVQGELDLFTESQATSPALPPVPQTLEGGDPNALREEEGEGGLREVAAPVPGDESAAADDEFSLDEIMGLMPRTERANEGTDAEPVAGSQDATVSATASPTVPQESPIEQVEGGDSTSVAPPTNSTNSPTNQFVGEIAPVQPGEVSLPPPGPSLESPQPEMPSPPVGSAADAGSAVAPASESLTDDTESGPFSPRDPLAAAVQDARAVVAAMPQETQEQEAAVHSAIRGIANHYGVKADDVYHDTMWRAGNTGLPPTTTESEADDKASISDAIKELKAKAKRTPNQEARELLEGSVKSLQEVLDGAKKKKTTKKSSPPSAEPRSTTKEPSNAVPADQSVQAVEKPVADRDTSSQEARASDQAAESDERPDDSQVREAGSGHQEESLADRVAKLPTEAREIAEMALAETDRLRRELLDQPDDKLVARDLAHAEKALAAYLDEQPKDKTVRVRPSVAKPKAPKTLTEPAKAFLVEYQADIREAAESVAGGKNAFADQVESDVTFKAGTSFKTFKPKAGESPKEAARKWLFGIAATTAADIKRKEATARKHDIANGLDRMTDDEKAGAKPKERPADTQAARDEYEAAAKAIHKRWTDPDKLNDFTEIVKDIGQLTYLATRAKMYEFRDYIRELAKHIDPALLRRYATEIETLWSNMADTERGKRLGLSKPEPVGLVLDEQAAASQSTGSTADEPKDQKVPKETKEDQKGPPGETGDDSGDSYSIKRRKVDEFHEKHSWDDVQKPNIPTMEEAQIQADELAQETMKSDPNFGYELMNRLLDDPLNASVSRLDVAVMQRLAAEAQVNYETAIEKLQEARARNADEKQIADLNRNTEDLHEKAKQIHEVGAIVSRTWHGVGMQLQAEFDRDLNRLDMEREWSLADEGRPLDDEGKAALKRIAAEAKRLKDENARLAKELEESNVEAATQKAHADAVREVLKAEQERRKALEEELARERAKPQGGHLVGGPSGGKPTVTRQPKARQNTQDAIARLRAKARELTFRKSVEFIPYSRYVELAPELIDVARAYISEKVATFQDFMDRLKADAADMAKQYADDWKAVWDGTKLNDITENIADQYDSENAATLTPIARELHRFVIERDGLGMNDAKKARHAVHEILKDFIPDLTITDTAKAMSGYDIYHPLNNNRTEVVRREQNARTGILLNIGEIWRTGHAKARGQERTPSSDEQRELVKVRNQAKKRHGKVTDEEKAGQLKSTLASMKTTLRNRIKDLQKEIAAHKRKIKTPANSPTDAELQDLQKQLTEVQALHEEAFGKRKLTDQQRQALLEKGLDRRYEELVALRESGNLWPSNRNPAVKTTPAIEAKRARNAAELAAIDELRLQSPEHAARVLTDRINQLDSQIAKLEKDLADNKLYSDPSTDTKIDNETTLFQKDRLAELKAEREDRRHSSGEFQLREEAKYVRQQLKTIAGWKTRIANEDFGPRPPKPERVRTEAMKKNDIELEKLREEFAKGKRDRWLKNRHPMKKLLDRAVLHPTNIIRKVLTSIDASLIGRQGWFAWVTHPILTAKAARQGFAQNPIKNWSIFPSVDDYYRTVAAIKTDPVLVDIAKRTGINLTEISGGLNREEGFQEVPDWVNKVPGLGGSERSASAFMDTLRTSLAVHLVTRLAQKREANGEPALTRAEMRVIGHFVNGMTGRQSLSQKADSSKWLANIFFSARWKASRMLWPVGGSVWMYDNRWLGGEGVGSDVRKAMLGEWVKQVAGVGTVIGVTAATLFLAYGAGGPDKEWEFVSDETSPKFGQFRIGDNWIDFTTGVGALISFPIRLWRGEKKGKWRSKKIDRSHEAMRFLQGNLAPAPGAVADAFIGTMDQTEIGSKEWYANRLTPLIVQDVQSLSNKDHIPASAVWDTAAFLGLGVKADRPMVRERADAADELGSLRDRANKSASPERRAELEQKIKDLLHDHLKDAVVKELKADLSAAHSDDEAKAIAARIKEAKSSNYKTTLSKESAADFQKEKYDIVIKASEALRSEDKTISTKTNDYKSGKTDPGVLAARELLFVIATTDDERTKLLREAWIAKEGEITKGFFPNKNRLIEAARQARQRQAGK